MLIINMHSPILISDYILVKLYPLTALALNYLTYISHGYVLGMTSKRLINDDVEAWLIGPVFPQLYYATRRYKGDNIDKTLYDNTRLDSSDADDRRVFLTDTIGENVEIINMVLDTYGKEPLDKLQKLLYSNGTPWKKYYKKRTFVKIPDAEIADHYSNIINQSD